MFKVRVVLAEAFKESMTSKPKVELAELVAVPEIVPVLELSVSPAGITPDTCDHVKGATPPFSDSGAEYDAPTFPDGSEVVVIWGGFPIVIGTAFDLCRDVLFKTATWTTPS